MRNTSSAAAGARSYNPPSLGCQSQRHMANMAWPLAVLPAAAAPGQPAMALSPTLAAAQRQRNDRLVQQINQAKATGNHTQHSYKQAGRRRHVAATAARALIERCAQHTQCIWQWTKSQLGSQQGAASCPLCRAPYEAVYHDFTGSSTRCVHATRSLRWGQLAPAVLPPPAEPPPLPSGG